jgi:hypothetical protein
MVIHNFHFQKIFANPAKINPPLIVNADAVPPQLRISVRHTFVESLETS